MSHNWGIMINKTIIRIKLIIMLNQIEVLYGNEINEKLAYVASLKEYIMR